MAANSKNVVTIAAKLIGGKAVIKESDAIGRSQKQLGKDVEEADKAASKAGHGWELFSRKQKESADNTKKHHTSLAGLTHGLVGAAVGFGGAYLGLSTVHDAISSVGEKAHELQQAQSLGLGGGEQTLDLITAYKARGIQMSTLAMSAKTLAKAQYTAQEQTERYSLAEQKAAASGKAMTTMLGTKAKAFQALGINLSEFTKLNPAQQLKMVDEKLSAMPASAEKTRLAVELLGKGGTKMLPVLVKGALGITSVEKAAKEFLPSLKGGTKGLEEMEVAQLKLSLATEGLKLRIGMALMPIVVKLMGTFTKLYDNISHGRGVWKSVDAVIGSTAKALGAAWHWLIHNETAMKAVAVVAGILIASLVVEKIVAFYEAVTSLTLIEKGWAAVQWVVNAALDANPIGIVILALAALGAAVGFVITHWKLFEKVLVGIWSWIKGHWKLLLPIMFGPLGLAAMMIIDHWKEVVGFFKSVPHKLAAAGKGMWNFIREEFKAAVNWIIGAWDKLNFKVPGVKTPFGEIGGFSIGLPHIPLLAEGGIIRSHGSVIVGDRGPEILTLPPGARVDPLAQHTRGSMPPGTWQNEGKGDLHVHVEIDRREIAQAVLKDFRFREARI